MSKTITIDIFNPESIRAAQREIQAYKQWVIRKTEELAQRLAEYGVQRVEVGYAEALYDGDKDITYTVEQRGERSYAIVASGKTVLFLEFGAGVIGEGHPLDGEFGYGPGTYPGQTHVPVPGFWWYTGSDGESHYSRGNPPSMVMYQTGKELRTELLRIAREVFSA